jgi:membrane protein DedA with SNARE-associated domain/membrane-associated phospholipid phosphatase
MMAGIARTILGLHGWGALAVIFAVPLAESAVLLGFVFPGEIAVMLGGVLASQHRVALVAAMAAAVAGAVLGDTIGYAVGQRWGRALVHGTIGRIVPHKHLDKGEAYLARRGGKAVFFGRYTATLRALIPGLAGMAGMRYSTFALCNVTGGLIWAIETTLVGYVAGAGWRHAATLASRIGLLVIIVLLIGVMCYALARRMAGDPTRIRRIAHRVASTRPAAWAARRFPTQLVWTRRRLDPACPTGLALTCALTLAAISTWIFAGLTQDVLAHDPITHLDRQLQIWVLRHRVGPVTTVMETVTWLGSTLTLVPLLAVASVYLIRAHRDLRSTAHLWIALAGAVLLYQAVKTLIARPRPPATQMILHATGYAFPSGHTTQATTVYALLAVVILTGPMSLSRRVRGAVVTVTIALVLSIGTSRIYLGAHWLTDVLGGYALATAWLAVIIAHRLRSGDTGPGPSEPTSVAAGRST